MFSQLSHNVWQQNLRYKQIEPRSALYCKCFCEILMSMSTEHSDTDIFVADRPPGETNRVFFSHSFPQIQRMPHSGICLQPNV